jgi:drug/metabolite transporter (DMT)-like permease
MAPSGRGRTIAAFLLLTLVWGTTWAVIRVGLAGIPPFTGVTLRFAIAGGLLFALAPRL